MGKGKTISLQNSDTKDSKTSIDVKQIPKGRIWLYRLILLVVIPFFFFLLLELSLRIFRVGYQTTAIIQNKVDGVLYLHDNPKFAYRYFSKNLAREFTPFNIPAKKQTNTYRIFILGGSAAQGTPEAAYSFSRMLNIMLKHTYPSVNFEVINMAMPAINSHVVFDITIDCLKYKPDAFILYMGNNETVGPYGPGTVFSPFTSNLTLIRILNTIKSWRIAQLLSNSMEKFNLKKEPNSHWKGMEMFLEKQVRFDDRELEQVYSNFEGNLRRIQRMAEQKGIPLIACTVGSNLKDSPPFSSLHKTNLTDEDNKQWNFLYKQGVAFEDNNQIDEAIHSYLAAAKIDSVFADLQFRLGHCYWKMGKFTDAKEKYKLALRFDTNRFRSDERINDIIRNVANAQASNNFVDTWETFQTNSPHGTPGEEFFLEHVHLNFRGNFLIAQSVFKKIKEIFPEDFKNKINNNKELTEGFIAKELVFTELSNYKINETVLNDYIKKPPFTNQLYHTESVTKLQTAIDTFKTNINHELFEKINLAYQLAIQHNPNDWMLHWKYAGLLASSDLKNDKEAEKHYRSVKNTLPHYPSAYVLLGLITGRLGNLNESLTLNEQALGLDPTIAEAYFNIALVYQIKKQNTQALEYYEKTLYYNPEHQRAYNNIGVIYYNQKKYSEAIKTLNLGIEQLPNDFELHYKLAYILNLAGRFNEATQILKKALVIDPGNKKAQEALNSLMK